MDELIKLGVAVLSGGLIGVSATLFAFAPRIARLEERVKMLEIDFREDLNEMKKAMTANAKSISAISSSVKLVSSAFQKFEERAVEQEMINRARGK